MSLVGDLGLGWFVVVVAGVWCGFMVCLCGLLLLMHDTLSGWLAVDFLVYLEVGFCCCCFELFCFVGPGFLVGVFDARCFVDLWASGGLVLGVCAMCLGEFVSRLFAVNACEWFLLWVLCVVVWVL